jgi:hypothetical protein
VVFEGETVITDSRDAEHDLARALLARGLTGTVRILDGNTGKPRTLVNIEKAARWCLGSNLEKYKYKAPETADSSPRSPEEPLVLPTLRSDREAA